MGSALLLRAAKRPRAGWLRAGISSALVAVAAWGSVAGAAPMTETRQVFSDPIQKLSVEVTGWLGLGMVAAGCSDGYLPVRFTVINGGETEAVIAVRFSPGFGIDVPVPSRRIVAPPNSTVRSTLLVGHGSAGPSPSVGLLRHAAMDFTVMPGGGPRREIECTIGQSWQSVASAGGAPSPTVIVDATPRILTPAAGRVLRAAQGGGDLGQACFEVDPTTAPEDWRAWSTLRELILTDDDWTALPDAARRAMLEWLSLGGHLILITTDADLSRLERLGLPVPDTDGRRRVAAGLVTPVAADALPRGEPPGQPLADPFAGVIERPADVVDPSWWGGVIGRRHGFEARNLPTAAILSFLALLAIVAGPVNILLLAGRGRPSRIFWTTPAISLVATALLLGLMVLRDGFGGDGVRRTICLLDPAHRTIGVLQEQFSRTGVLLASSFPIREPSCMLPRPVRATADSGGFQPVAGGAFLEIDDARRSGDWFTSRSDQAATLQGVRPGRGRIEVVGPADAPEVLSSLEVPLERVLVADREGRWWRTGPLGAGERRRLEPGSVAEFETARRELLSGGSPEIVRALNRSAGLPAFVWAEAADPRAVAIATLDAIRWKHDEAWFIGPLVRGEER